MRPGNIVKIGDVNILTSHFMIAWCAWLGIKKAGKTYGAKGVAEQLLDQGVPLVVFDAIGMWRHLKVPSGNRGGRGYEIVVAGGEEADIPLNPQNAAEIVRASMRSNVSLIVDLYDPKLSKQDWRRIVQAGFHTLLYENKKFGPRYVILEEAAEFVPQKVMDGETYAAVEKAVRMGGNVGLGGALITPRSQEINKAVLDLCDNLVLMRQRGSAAIDALKKWMDKIPDAKIAEQIVASLPVISNGQCWVWAEDADIPARTQTARLNSFHPDRTNPVAGSVKAPQPVDTAAFVSKLLADLPKVVEERKANDPVELRKRIAELERQLARRPVEAELKAVDPVSILTDDDRALLRTLRDHNLPGVQQALIVNYEAALKELQSIGKRLAPVLDKVASMKAPARLPLIQSQKGKLVARLGTHEVRSFQKPAPPADGVSPVGQKILNAIAELELLKVHHPVREMVALMAGYTNLASTGYAKATSTLRTMDLIDYPDADTVALTEAGRKLAVYPEAPRSSAEIQNRVCQLIGGKASEILRPLIEAYPHAMTREDVASAANYTNLASTGFAKAVSRLRTLGFVDYPDSHTMVATSVLFLE